MANPKKKHTSMRTGMRRSNNWRIVGENLSKCSNCAAPALSHQVCPKCGFYKGQLVSAPKIKKSKKDQEKEGGNA